jgi:hypothetical protein
VSSRGHFPVSLDKRRRSTTRARAGGWSRRAVDVVDHAWTRQILELYAFAGEAPGGAAVIEQVVAQAPVVAGSGPERLQLGGAAACRLGTDLEDAANWLLPAPPTWKRSRT